MREVQVPHTPSPVCTRPPPPPTRHRNTTAHAQGSAVLRSTRAPAVRGSGHNAVNVSDEHPGLLEVTV